MKILGLKLLNFFHFWRQALVNMILSLASFIYVRVYLVILAFLNLLNWIVVFIINKNVNQDLIFLHYNVTFGVDLIGNANKVFIMPFLGLIIILINLILL